MSTPFNPVADLTDRQRPAGPGMSMYRQWGCGHKGSTTGALLRPMPRPLAPLALLCPTCNAKRIAALESTARTA